MRKESGKAVREPLGREPGRVMRKFLGKASGKASGKAPGKKVAICFITYMTVFLVSFEKTCYAAENADEAIQGGHFVQHCVNNAVPGFGISADFGTCPNIGASADFGTCPNIGASADFGTCPNMGASADFGTCPNMGASADFEVYQYIGAAKDTGTSQDFEWNGDDGDILPDIMEEAEGLLEELGLSELDAYMRQEDFGQLTFSQLIRELLRNGLEIDFASVGAKLKQAVLADYAGNRTVLGQILALAVAFSVLLQMTSSIQKSYISDLGFLGIYLILMLLLLRLFLIMAGTAESFLAKLVEFMQMLQPAFCMSMVFSTGSISAGAYYQLLLLLIYLIDVVFAKVLLPAIQVHMVLQLVNHMMDEKRFSRIAELLSDSVHWCVKILTTSVVGLNIVQSLLAPGIDGLKRSTVANTVRAIPGAGQVMNSMAEILAGSAMLIKNSVGVAALIVLVAISFLPLVKIAVFMMLYRGCAALMEPVADKRFCAAVSALGQSAALYLKLMFYAVLLFFLTVAIICASTTLFA